ncbi:hypothetical protein GW755_01775 [bacterium]|nr:hypothetical protein [bacterium]
MFPNNASGISTKESTTESMGESRFRLFAQTSEDTVQELKQRWGICTDTELITDLREPKLMFVLEEDPNNIHCNNLIGVNIFGNSKNFDGDLLKLYQAGQLYFIGSIEDFARLQTIEEMHHISNPNLFLYEYDPLIDNLTEYDAQEVEWQALIEQLKIAKEWGMPDITLNCLRERVKNAEEVRKISHL